MLEANNLNNFTGSIGPDIVTNGLVFYNDYSNPKCYISGDTICNDLSNNQLTGTISGCTYSGNSLYFDGVDDYGLTNSNLDLSNTNKCTVSFWVKFTSLSESVLLENSTNYNSNNAFIISINKGKIVGGHHTVDGYNFGSISSATNNGNWNHFTMVCDRSLSGAAKTTMYLNNLQNYYSVLTQNLTGNFGVFELYFGARAENSYFFNGNISSVQIYNRALSQQEITQNYNATRGRFNL